MKLHSIWPFFALLAAMLLNGCARAPFDYPAETSFAVHGNASTELGIRSNAWSDAHPETSGIYPLVTGREALEVRKDLIETAQQSIDIQTFLIHDDVVGHTISQLLLQAGERDVRVRLLVDDIHTSDVDPMIALLNAHKNIEVRLFNPYPEGSATRGIKFATDFHRMNRRMHNKSMTIDNLVSVVGGRNIGAEYFEQNPDISFVDYDLMVIGPITPSISSAFDEYWNSGFAVPVSAYEFASDDDVIAAGRSQIDAGSGPESMLPGTATGSVDVVGELLAGTLAFEPVQARLLYEKPGKADRESATEATRMASQLREMGANAAAEILIVSPYFIPQEEGVEYLKSIRERGVRIVVLTNSLASTNQRAVHASYARYRKDMLQLGIELYELKVDGGLTEQAIESGDDADLTLHAKTIVIDRRTMFVGSMNLDPRSLDINTEMGLVVDAPALARDFVADVLAALPEYAYRVTLDDDDDLIWTTGDEDQTSVQTHEPDSGAWRRFSTWMLGLAPIEGQL